MPTELEELVEFLHHGNTDIRKVAIENLVGYSKAQPTLFKRQQLEPIRDLKLLVKDYPPISKQALTILINLSSDDEEVLKCLAEDDAFLETLLLRITKPKEPSLTDLTQLLSNLSKHPSLTRLVTLKRKALPKDISQSLIAIDQLLDCFVKAEGADKDGYDCLAYVFGELAKDTEMQTYLTTSQDSNDSITPLSKLLPFTSHSSPIRRRGVASTLKNVGFYSPCHPKLLSSSDLNVLPYVLLPLAGPDNYTEAESDQLLPDLQLLPADKEREGNKHVLLDLLGCLLLLCSTKDGRIALRDAGTYLVVREFHLANEDEEVRAECERLVDLLMRREEGDPVPEEEGRIMEVGRDGGNVDLGSIGSGRMQENLSGARVEEVDSEDELVDVA